MKPEQQLEETEAWYAVRWERLRELLRDTDLEEVACAIMANGSASFYEPPTYAQILYSLQHDRSQAQNHADTLLTRIENLEQLLVQVEQVFAPSYTPTPLPPMTPDEEAEASMLPSGWMCQYCGNCADELEDIQHDENCLWLAIHHVLYKEKRNDQ